MTTSTFTALGFNPAPGALANIENAANQLQYVAKEMGEARDMLNQIGKDDGIWTGDAAQAFAGTVGDLPKYLEAANSSLGSVSQTLHLWHTDLASMQRTAAIYEQQAVEAQQRIQQAESNPDFKLVGQHFDDDVALQQANSRVQAAQENLNRAEAELNEIKEDAKRLLDQHTDLAQQVEDALNKAAAEAPEAPGLFDRLGDALNKLGTEISDAASKVWGWIEKHAEDINKVGDVLSTVGTVLSIVAAATSWIPGVDVVTAAAAVGVSGAALAAHGLAKAAGAKVSWKTMAFDALGAIPGAGAAKGSRAAAKILPKVAKQAGAAAKGAEGGKLATGAEAAAKAFRHEGETTIGKHANYANKAINVFNKATGQGIPRVSVDAADTGAKNLLRKPEMEYTATSHGAVAVGSAVYAGKTAAVQVGEHEAEPYIDQAKDYGKERLVGAAEGFRGALAGARP